MYDDSRAHHEIQRIKDKGVRKSSKLLIFYNIRIFGCTYCPYVAMHASSSRFRTVRCKDIIL